MNEARVAIVGAGVAGLGAAWALARQGIAADVFEAAPRLGGRCVTGRRGPAQFDTGAQFFRTDMPLARSIVLERLPSADLLDIRKDVAPFDSRGGVGAGDPAQNALPKWVYRHGIGTLPELLARASRATVHLGCHVERLDRTDSGWRLETGHGRSQPFDAVVMSAPPRAASRVLERSHADSGQALCDVLGSASYRAIVSVALRPEAPVEAPAGFYAMVNSDRGHAVSWLAFEHEKPGYVPPGECVLVAQMASRWSIPRLAASDRALAFEAAEAVSGLFGTSIRPRWWNVTRWKEALPDSLVEASALALSERDGLFFAGDATVGGRVHLALESGVTTAHRIVECLPRR